MDEREAVDDIGPAGPLRHEQADPERVFTRACVKLSIDLRLFGRCAWFHFGFGSLIPRALMGRGSQDASRNVRRNYARDCWVRLSSASSLRICGIDSSGSASWASTSAARAGRRELATIFLAALIW